MYWTLVREYTPKLSIFLDIGTFLNDSIFKLNSKYQLNNKNIKSWPEADSILFKLKPNFESQNLKCFRYLMGICARININYFWGESSSLVLNSRHYFEKIGQKLP